MHNREHIIEDNRHPRPRAFLNVGPAGHQQRLNISPENPSGCGPVKDRRQRPTVLASHSVMISKTDITCQGVCARAL